MSPSRVSLITITKSTTTGYTDRARCSARKKLSDNAVNRSMFDRYVTMLADKRTSASVHERLVHRAPDLDRWRRAEGPHLATLLRLPRKTFQRVDLRPHGHAELSAQCANDHHR